MTMNFDLSHHVALVTGGGRGFGRAIACHLAAAGAAVAVTSRSADELRQTVSLIEAAGGKAFAVTGDVTERADVERIVAATEQALGGISIFINNAGVPDPFGPIGVIDPDRWWHTQAVHVRAPMLFLTALLPGMQQRGLGRIVLVSAKASRVDAPNLSAYCVAKTGQNRIARMVAAENVDNGLAIFAIDPGFAYTELAASTAKSPDAQRWLPGMVGRLNALAESAGSDDDLRRCGERCVALASGRYDALSGSYMELPDDPEVLLAAKQAPTA
ncbi:MAG: SDR family oxidoreductase [Gammaproteobacteria bacterium]|nr:SDR family oxidoreductase [Gammaproteobacteria bacterium]